jgi:hypothetical protein
MFFDLLIVARFDEVAEEDSLGLADGLEDRRVEPEPALGADERSI